MTTLEVQQDDKIYVIKDCPENLTMYTGNQTKEDYKAYYQALASCERIVCADQEQAKDIIWQFHRAYYKVPPGIYQVPVEWEEKEYLQDDTGLWIDGEQWRSKVGVEIKFSESRLKKLAILKKSPKEESATDLWIEAIDIIDTYDAVSFEDYNAILELRDKFTITRRKK